MNQKRFSGRSSSPAAARHRREKGFTLVELLVAIALGLFVVAVVIQGFAATTASNNTNSAIAESHTNGRHALEVLKRELRHAALHRLVWESSQFVNNDATLAAKDYGCGAGFVTQLDVGVVGFNDSNPYDGSCLKDASDRDYARGDVVVLRRTALQPATAFENGAPYVRASYGVANLFVGGTATDAPLLPEPRFDYRLVSDVYFVNAFTTSADENPKVPALYRLTLSAGANPTMTPELVASNVEHLQMQFAVTDSGGNVRYFNANDVTDWAAVTTARIWLLVRDSNPESGMVSGKYEMGDVTYEPKDRYRRAVYSTTIAIRNH